MCFVTSHCDYTFQLDLTDPRVAWFKTRTLDYLNLSRQDDLFTDMLERQDGKAVLKLCRLLNEPVTGLADDEKCLVTAYKTYYTHIVKEAVEYEEIGEWGVRFLVRYSNFPPLNNMTLSVVTVYSKNKRM